MSRKFLGKIYRRLCPSNMQARLDCFRALPSWKEKKVIFVHVPKSAGMSISTALYGKALGHIKAADIKKYQPEVYGRCFKFAFVRDPVLRYLSAWSYMQKNFDEIDGGPGLPPRELVSLDPVAFAKEWLVGKDVDSLNFIFRSQACFVFDGENVLVDYVARFERFNEEVAFLSNKIPEILDLPVINSSGSEDVNVDLEELGSVIREVYKNDYELLGYSE